MIIMVGFLVLTLPFRMKANIGYKANSSIMMHVIEEYLKAEVKRVSKFSQLREKETKCNISMTFKALATWKSKQTISNDQSK